MQEYHKINALFKRHTEGKQKGKLILGDWSVPEFGYLSKNQWEFTEKVDGTNIRVLWAPSTSGPGSVHFAGRTDRATIPAPLLAYLEATFTPELFKAAGYEATMVLYGEGYGPKIQSGGKYTGGEDVHSFVLFDVKIGDWWLMRKDVDDIAAKLGIDSVPTIGYGTLQDAIDIVSSGITFNETGAVQRWGSGTLYSRWGNFAAEGIVARPTVPLFNRKGERIITKIKAVDFK